MPSHGQRYTREHRLLRPEQFKRVYASRLRAVEGAVRVACVRNGQPLARLGVAIGRRSVASAAVRNRLKRLARETFRRQQAPLAGLDLVLTVEPQAVSLRNRDFVLVLQRLFAKIGACKSS
ncbi:MAG: ribonuclease P protein component [Chromatiales bacterium]